MLFLLEYLKSIPIKETQLLVGISKVLPLELNNMCFQLILK